jgi:hypothetical protein
MGFANFDSSQLPGYWREPDAQHALGAWQASGLSLAAFARQHGLQVQRLRRWKQRLLEEPKTNEARFVRLVVREDAEPKPLRLHIGQLVIEVPNGFDADALLRLVDVLSC